jgi:predicted RNase H-like HicB family nuclease
MLIEYINNAMKIAVYEKMEDGTYCGKIPQCPGTISFGKTLYESQEELRAILEGWLIVKIRHGDPLPIIGNIDLNKGIPVLEKSSVHE